MKNVNKKILMTSLWVSLGSVSLGATEQGGEMLASNDVASSVSSPTLGGEEDFKKALECVESSQGEQKKLEEGMTLLVQAAQKGHPEAAFYLFQMCISSLQGEKNSEGKQPSAEMKELMETGLGWLKVAAQGGHSKASLVLGGMMLEGSEGEEGIQKGLSLITQAFEKGEAAAGPLLAQAYLEGKGVAQDTQKALKYLTESYEKGSLEAGMGLVTFYLTGLKGVTKDPEKAVSILEDLGGKGSAEAALFLGMIYLEGNVVKADKEKALKWALKAKELGVKKEADSLIDRAVKGLGTQLPKGQTGEAPEGETPAAGAPKKGWWQWLTGK